LSIERNMEEGKMRFDIAGCTDAAGRVPNEDACGSFNSDQKFAWVVADGLGGHVSGELASQAAVDLVKKMLESNSPIDQNFSEMVFSHMQREIADLHGPLTTAVCAFSDGETLYYANVGDSRLFFFRNQERVALTRDHTLAYIDYLRGAVDYEDLATHPLQNRLLHAVGSDTNFICDNKYDSITLAEGDAFLLCTDGFWELVSGPEIQKSLSVTTTAQDWLETMLAVLKSKLKPTSDNYTAICVRVIE